MNCLRIQDVVDALNGDESAKTKVFGAIDHQEWMSSEVVLRTPGRQLITPVEIDGWWTSLVKPEVVETPAVAESDVQEPIKPLRFNVGYYSPRGPSGFYTFKSE